MKVLIDTQILIWFQNDSPNLNFDIRDLIQNEANQVCVSCVSFYEIAIKHKIGKLPGVGTSVKEFMEQVRLSNFTVLPLADDHISRYGDIPFYHRDPYDHMILATALAEGISVVSADGDFRQYEDIITLIRA